MKNPVSQKGIRWALCCLLISLIALPTFAQFRVIGYVPSWAGDVNTVQYAKLTHVNYAFLLPTATGGLQPIENPAKLQSLVALAHARGVKVLISVGGWNDGNDSNFETLGGNAGYRNTFVTNLINFANQYNLDGVDIDWEYPDAGTSANNYALLMQQLATEMHNRGKLLTAAVVGTGGAGVLNSVFGYVDFLNLMAYDANNFDHSTYGYATECIGYWAGRGLPANKLVLGVPFYGRPSWESYAQLLARGANPNADVFNGVGYNGIPTIKSKTNLAFDRGSGIMIWELSQDATGASSLLTAINQVVALRGNPAPPPTGVTNLSGLYTLQNRNSNLLLDVTGISPADGARAQQWSATGGTNQQFRFTHLGNGVYQILAVNSGKSLDVTNQSPADGAPVQQWTYSGGANQQFIVQSVGSGYYKLFARHSNKLLEVAGSALAPGGPVQQWPDNNQLTGQWKLTPVGVPAFSSTIQAEAYGSMSGIQVEATTDAGGGQSVGYIDAGDWLAYPNVMIPTTGSYLIEYRVASPGGATLSADLNAGTIPLGNVAIPATGGWQSWTTVSQTVALNAGTYNFGVYAQRGGWNFNWLRISRASSARPTALAAPEARLMSAPKLELYPNPVADQLQLLTAQNLAGSTFQVLDAVGRSVAQGTGEAGSIDVAGLKPGVYLLRLTFADHSSISQRFSK